VNEADIRRQANYWTQVLDRIVNVTITLACNNIAFRDHREHNNKELNRGDFLAVIDLSAKYDPVLEQLLEKPKGIITHLSPKIHNEIIALLAESIKSEIVVELKEAPFFSIIMETTQDVSKIDQLSTVYRYVNVPKDKNGVPTDLNIYESFLGFEVVDSQNAVSLQEQIYNSMKEKGLTLEKLRGQGYIGAATMSGVYS
jgi:hypothetical protein